MKETRDRYENGSNDAEVGNDMIGSSKSKEPTKRNSLGSFICRYFDKNVQRIFIGDESNNSDPEAPTKRAHGTDFIDAFDDFQKRRNQIKSKQFHRFFNVGLCLLLLGFLIVLVEFIGYIAGYNDTAKAKAILRVTTCLGIIIGSVGLMSLFLVPLEELSLEKVFEDSNFVCNSVN